MYRSCMRMKTSIKLYMNWINRICRYASDLTFMQVLCLYVQFMFPAHDRNTSLFHLLSFLVPPPLHLPSPILVILPSP